MEKYKNKKTEEIYFVLYKDVIDATNLGDSTNLYVIYQNSLKGFIFMREQKEFFEKFTKIDE